MQVVGRSGPLRRGAPGRCALPIRQFAILNNCTIPPYASNAATLSDWPLSLGPSCKMNGAAIFAHASALG